MKWNLINATMDLIFSNSWEKKLYGEGKHTLGLNKEPQTPLKFLFKGIGSRKF
jgi:hypothetical protein